MSEAFEVGAGGGEVGAGGGEVGPGGGSSAPAGLASGTGSAFDATVVTTNPNAPAQAASGTGAAFDATVSTSNEVSAPAGAASGTGAAGAASVSVASSAGLASGSGAAGNATGKASASAGAAAGTGAAFNATVVAVSIIGEIVQPAGSFFYQETPPAVGSDALPMAGAPSYPLTLFRGAVIGVSADRDNGFLRLVLDCEDYNRQWALIHVGVPIVGNQIVQPDGTAIDVDPDAQNYGIGPGDGGVVKHFVDRYWPAAPFTPDPDLSDVQNTNPDYSTVPMFDRQTASSTLDAILGEFVRQRGSGASRFWVRPVGDDLVLTYRVVGFFDGLPDQRVPAPFALSTEGKAGTIMANIRADWDAHALRRRVRVNGGTPAACLYVENPGPVDVPTNAGDAFVDAPGALTRLEAEAVGAFHLRNNLREFLIAHVYVPPGHLEGSTYVRNDGWEEGQSTVLSDTLISGFAGNGPSRILPMLEDREAIVQTVRWNQVTSAPGTGIAIDGVDLSDFVVAWEELSGERRLGSPGKATIAVYLWNPPGTDIAVRTLADVKIWLDGTSDVEYNLEVGDVPAGDIAIQFNRDQRQPYTPPAMKFTYIVSDPDMPVGGTSDVTITATRANYEPRDLAGLTVIPILLSWADAGETIPSDEYTLDDDGLPLVLNAVAQAYTVLRRVAGTTGFDHYKILTVASPKVEV